jgi:hypothetical protein
MTLYPSAFFGICRTAKLRVRPHDDVPASAGWVDGYCAYPPLSLGSALAHERHFHDAVVHGPVATPRMHCLNAPTLHGSGSKETRWKSNVHVIPIDSDGLFRTLLVFVLHSRSGMDCNLEMLRVNLLRACVRRKATVHLSSGSDWRLPARNALLHAGVIPSQAAVPKGAL